MRTLLIAAAASIILTGCDPKPGSDYAAAETELKTEKELLAENLEANKQSFLAMVDGLSEQQLMYRESEDRWNIAEIAEHIVISEGAFQGFIQQALDAEPVEGGKPDTSMTDEQIAAMMADRSQTFQAPAAAVPQGTMKSVEQIETAFNEARAKTMEMLNTEADLRKQIAPHPLLGPMDAHGWFVFLKSHCDRHLAQMQQVKDHPGYPGPTI